MSKGRLEDEITKRMIEWEKDYMGRGPTGAKTDIIRDMIIVSLKGVLSTAEERLALDKEGMIIIKKVRRQLIEQGRKELEDIIFKLTTCKVVSLHTDISTKTGERILIFRIDQEIK